MNAILSFLSSCFSTLFAWFTEFLGFLKAIVAKGWHVLVAGFLAVVAYAVDSVASWVHSLVGVLDNMAFPQGSTVNFGTILDLVNTFFPVGQTFTFLAGYLTLIGLLSGYRLIKSWIPTLAG